MNLYLAYFGDHEESYDIGVFTTPEKAWVACVEDYDILWQYNNFDFEPLKYIKRRNIKALRKYSIKEIVLDERIGHLNLGTK